MHACVHVHLVSVCVRVYVCAYVTKVHELLKAMVNSESYACTYTCLRVQL